MHELRVLTGKHQGAALPLFGEQWIIGSDTLCDLRLDDDDIQALHAELQSDEAGWQLRIAGQSASITPEVPFHLADVQLLVSAADRPWPPAVVPAAEENIATPLAQAAVTAPASPPPTLLPRWARIVALAMMLLLMITITSWILQPGLAQPETVSEQVKPRLADSKALAAHLLQQLRERDLQRSVQIVRQSAEVVVQGELDEEQHSQVARLVKNIQHDYDLGVALRDATRIKKVTLPFRIVQITAGARANIVTEGGHRLFIGDEQDGLRLVAITASQIQFAGRNNITVKW